VPTLDYLARRFGPLATSMTTRVADLAKAEGLDFDFGAALTVNTLDAHRLLHLAADVGVGGAAKERLLRALSGAQSAETFLHALRTAYAAEDAAAR